jgi:hypothetical protein
VDRLCSLGADLDPAIPIVPMVRPGEGKTTRLVVELSLGAYSNKQYPAALVLQLPDYQITQITNPGRGTLPLHPKI